MIFSQICTSCKPPPCKTAKDDKDFSKRLDFKDIKCPVRTTDNHKIDIFAHENMGKYPIHVLKKCCEEKHVDLLLIGEERRRHYVLVKDFIKLMHDHTIYLGR